MSEEAELPQETPSSVGSKMVSGEEVEEEEEGEEGEVTELLFFC